MMNLAETINKLRKQKGLTQKEVARALNISPTAVNKWEKGTTSPDIDNLLPLSRLLNVSVDDLLKDGSMCTSEQLRTYVLEVFHLIEQDSFLQAFNLATSYLDDYPNDLALQTNLLSMLLTSHYGRQSVEQHEVAKSMHSLVTNNFNEIDYSLIEVLMKYYLSIEDYSRAEEILELLPKQSPLYSSLKADFHRSIGDYPTAYKTYEEILYGSQLMINNILISLKLMAENEGNENMAAYYVKKRIEMLDAFEIGKFAQLGALLDDPNTDLMNYQNIKELLHSIPTLDSFVRSKLYSHMTFNIEENHFLYQQIYQDFLADLTDEEQKFDLSDEEREKLIQFIELELNKLSSENN